MKQMTKEELIEYFIEQLGDNEILGQVMTIEQIREKLNTVIKDVGYTEDKKIFDASWQLQQDGTGIVNFDINKIPIGQDRRIIVHELLHALSASAITLNKNYEYEKKKEKSGLGIGTVYYCSDGEINSYLENVALNEGLIDFLAVQITGVKNPGYEEEKNIYQILAELIGADVMLKKAFITEVSTPLKARDLFKEDLISKYGDDLGIKLNENVKKILTLSDQLLDLNRKDSLLGLNENGKRLQNQTKSEIYDTLYNMIEQIIDREPEILKKVELLTKFENTKLRGKLKEQLFTKLMKDIVNDENINFKDKIDILKSLKIAPPEDIARKLILESNESESLTEEEKLKNYIDICRGHGCNKIELYKLYINSGLITEEEFNKYEIFKSSIKGSSFDIITTNLENIRYRKVGNYYFITNGDPYIIGSIYNKDGTIADEEAVGLEKKDISSIAIEDVIDKEIDRDILVENIKSKIEEYEKSFNEDKDRKIIAIFYDGMIMLRSQMDLDSECFYKINQDGTLELIEQRRRKKIYRRYV